MALPKIQQALFELVIPSTGKTIRHRLFTVREEKILLLAQESKDPKQALLAMKQVLNNCLVDVDVDTLATFDLEYLLLSIRGKSVDNKIEFTIKDPETAETVKLGLDINDVQIVFDPEHSNKIRLNEEYVLFLRYPTIVEFEKMIENGAPTPEANYDLMVSCFDQLVSEEVVIKFKDFTEEEIAEFANDLDSNMIKELKKFFDTMPKLRHEIKYKNKNGKEQTFVIEGMETFFI